MVNSIPRPLLAVARKYVRSIRGGIPSFLLIGSKTANVVAETVTPSKHPLTKHWQVLATTDEKKIRDWSAKWPFDFDRNAHRQSE